MDIDHAPEIAGFFVEAEIEGVFGLDFEAVGHRVVGEFDAFQGVADEGSLDGFSRELTDLRRQGRHQLVRLGIEFAGEA